MKQLKVRTAYMWWLSVIFMQLNCNWICFQNYEQEKYTLQREVELKSRMLESLSSECEAIKQDQKVHLEKLEEQLSRTHGQEVNELKNKVWISMYFRTKMFHAYAAICKLRCWRFFLVPSMQNSWDQKELYVNRHGNTETRIYLRNLYK